MAGAGVIQRSFAGGIVSNSLLPRRDVAKVDAGLRACTNWQVSRSGAVFNRPGFEYVAEVKTASDNARVEPFVFNEDSAFALEVGAGYIRFHSEGGPVTVTPVVWSSLLTYVPGSVVSKTAGPVTGTFYAPAQSLNKDPDTVAYQTQFWYPLTLLSSASGESVLEVPTPYSATEVTELDLKQSGNTITFTHEDHPPYALVFGGGLLWTFLPVRYAPSMPGPVDIAVGTPSGNAGNYTVRYRITAIRRDTLEESLGGPHETVVANCTIDDDSATSEDDDLEVTDVSHGLATGDEIYVTLVETVDADEANQNAVEMLQDRIFSVTVVDANTFTLDGTAGTLAMPPIAAAWPSIQIDYAKAYLEFTSQAVPATGTSANNIQLEWAAPSGVEVLEYWIYRSKDKGPFGFVKATKELEWLDIGEIDPDLEFTPPNDRTVFRAGKWPRTSGYFQQRQAFAGTEDDPQKFWLSQTGDFRNFTTHSPLEDDDAIEATIAAVKANEIQNIVSLGQLILLTNGALWTAKGDSDGVIKPSAINLEALSYEGASSLTPLLVGDSVLFTEARRSVVRELRFDIAAGGYSGYKPRDLTVYAPHLFDGYTIVDWAFCAVPTPTIWAVRSDGALLGLTYLFEQEVWAWHQHDTGDGDEFISVAAIPEEGYDALYAIVKRTVDGSDVYYVERMADRKAGYAGVDERSVDKFLDSFLTYDGTNSTATTLTLTGGTTWAAGETGLTLTASASTFPGDASNVSNGYRLVGADGEEVEVKVTTDGSTTVQTVTLLTAAPASTRGTATSTWVEMVDDFSGLDHLEGRSVYLLADSNVLGPYTVESGAIDTLARPYGIVHAGLQIVADVEPLDLDLVTPGDTLADRKKKVESVTLFLDNSRGVTVGPDADNLREYQPPQTPDDELALITGQARYRFGTTINEHGRVLIRQAKPLPATVTALIRHVEVGGREP